MNVDLVFGRLGLSSPQHKPAILKAKELLRRSNNMTSCKGTTCKAIAIPAACCLLALEHLEVAVPGAKDARSLSGKVQVLSGATAKGFKDTVSTLRTALHLRRGRGGGGGGGGARTTSAAHSSSSLSHHHHHNQSRHLGRHPLSGSSSSSSSSVVSVHRMCLVFGCPELEGKVMRLLEEYRREFVRSLHESRRGSADFSSPVFSVAAFFLVAKKNKQSSSLSGGRRGLQETYDLSGAEFSRVIQSMEEHCPSIRTATKQTTNSKRKRKDDGDDEAEDARECYQLQEQYEEWKRAACASGKRERDAALHKNRAIKQTRLDFSASHLQKPPQQSNDGQEERPTPPVF